MDAKIKPIKYKQDNVLNIETNTFHYLDLELFCYPGEELYFQIHWKTNQTFKDMNKGSTQTNAAFNATPIDILNRLARLISRTKKNYQIIMDEKYHEHSKALKKSGLAQNIFQTLKEIRKKADVSKLNIDPKLETRSGERRLSTYLCIGFSKIWCENVYDTI